MHSSESADRKERPGPTALLQASTRVGETQNTSGEATTQASETPENPPQSDGGTDRGEAPEKIRLTTTVLAQIAGLDSTARAYSRDSDT